jgi:hypothetical protein
MAEEIKWFTEAKVNITKTVLTDILLRRENSHHFEPNDLQNEAYIFL